MPKIQAECNYCGSDYNFDATFEVDSAFSRCSECCNDVCKFCGNVEEEIHPICKRLRDEFDEQGEVET